MRESKVYHKILAKRIVSSKRDSSIDISPTTAYSMRLEWVIEFL